MSYSADTALQIAMQMEKLGKIFYQALADSSQNAEIAAIAAKLAADERKHLWTLQRMYYSLPIDQCGAKLTEEQLEAAAGKYYSLILPTADEVRQVAQEGDMAKILAMAIQMEADSIAYYSSMAGTVGSDAAVLKSIVQEEKKHLERLSEYKRTAEK